jgi:hypothetical protein
MLIEKSALARALLLCYGKEVSRFVFEQLVNES